MSVGSNGLLVSDFFSLPPQTGCIGCKRDGNGRREIKKTSHLKKALWSIINIMECLYCGPYSFQISLTTYFKVTKHKRHHEPSTALFRIQEIFKKKKCSHILIITIGTDIKRIIMSVLSFKHPRPSTILREKGWREKDERYKEEIRK